MSTTKQQVAEARIKAAMSSLVGNPEFAEFINMLRQQREAAVFDLCQDSTIANDRATLSGIGEIRMYSSVIALFDEYRGRAVGDGGEPLE